MVDEVQDDIVVKVDEAEPEATQEQQRERDEQGRFVAKSNGEAKPSTDLAVAEMAKQFEELKAKDEQREKERTDAIRRAREAEQRAQQARREAEEVRTSAVDSELGHVGAALQAAQVDADAAEAAYAKAMEEGNFGEAAKAQRRMARAEADIARFTEAKADVEARKAQPAGKKEAAEKLDKPADAFESYLTQFTPSTASWLRDHREWVEDSRKNQKLTAAHHDAVSEGLTADTPEYFEHVEKFIGLQSEESKSNGSARAAADKTQRRSTPPVAPVGNAAGGSVNGGGSEVRLSKGEAAAATDGTLTWNYDDPSGNKRFKKGDPIGLQEMARRKLELQKRGAYDKNRIDA